MDQKLHGDASFSDANASRDPEGARNIVTITYALYALSIVIGISSIVGVIIAHIKRSSYEGTVYADHMTWLIRTFWISFLLGVIGVITMYFLIGLPILIAAAVWFIYRVVKGFLILSERKTFKDPRAFL
jgi:uncharacterized membrane protein